MEAKSNWLLEPPPWKGSGSLDQVGCSCSLPNGVGFAWEHPDDGSRDAHDLVQFVEDARAGKNHVGGLPGGDDGMPDEDDGYRVEL